MTNAESEPVIYEGIGLALTKMGWIGIKQEEIYTSFFIKLESPLLGVDVCNTPCGLKKEALRILTKRQECLNDKRIGNGLELRRVDTPKFEKDLIVTCLSLCIEDDACKGVTVVEKGDLMQCILRKTTFSSLKRNEDSRGEIVLTCLMEDKQQFCADLQGEKLTNFRMGKPTRKKRSWLLAGVMLSGLSLRKKDQGSGRRAAM